MTLIWPFHLRSSLKKLFSFEPQQFAWGMTQFRQVTVSFPARMQAWPEGRKFFSLAKVHYSQGKCQLLVRISPSARSEIDLKSRLMPCRREDLPFRGFVKRLRRGPRKGRQNRVFGSGSYDISSRTHVRNEWARSVVVCSVALPEIRNHFLIRYLLRMRMGRFQRTARHTLLWGEVPEVASIPTRSYLGLQVRAVALLRAYRSQC